MIRNVRAQQGEEGITVSWEHDESGPPENFEVQSQPDGGTWTPLTVVPYVPGVTAYSTVHENPTGAGVRYQVRAVNSVGASPWAESNRVPLLEVPNAPTNVTAT